MVMLSCLCLLSPLVLQAALWFCPLFVIPVQRAEIPAWRRWQPSFLLNGHSLRAGWFLVRAAMESWSRRKVAQAGNCTFRFSLMVVYLSMPLHGIVASFVQQPSLLSPAQKNQLMMMMILVLLKCVIVSLLQSLCVVGKFVFSYLDTVFWLPRLKTKSRIHLFFFIDFLEPCFCNF